MLELLRREVLDRSGGSLADDITLVIVEFSPDAPPPGQPAASPASVTAATNE